MKGLITKTAYSLIRKNEMFIIILLLMNAIFMTILTDYSFLAIFTMFFAAVLVQDQIADEGKNKYDSFQNVLPVTYKEIVISRYLFAFGFMVCAAITSFIAAAFVGFMFDYPFDYISFIVQSSLFALLSFILLCVLFPFYFKFGTKYVRIISILIVAIPTVINYLVRISDSLMPITKMSALVIISGILCSALVIATSLLLSFKIAKTKFPTI